MGIVPPAIDIAANTLHSPFLCELSAAIQIEKVMAGQLLYAEG